MTKTTLARQARKSGCRLFVLTALLLIPLLLQTASAPVHARALDATNLTVNTGTVVQSNFLGTNAVYHGFSYMPESNNQGMTDSLRTIDFDRIQGIQLHIARTWYGSDWAMPTWGGAYNWNSTKMTAFYNWLQAMKDRNVSVVLSLGWWFPQNVCAPDQPSTCTPRVPDDVNIYTHWISDSLNQLINVKGFTNIKYGTLFTEPLGYTSGNVPSGYTDYTFYQYVANQLQTQLTNDGRRNLIQIVGPNACCFSSNTDPLTWSVSNLNNVFDVYSSHDYGLSGYNAWYSMVKTGVNDVASTGKPFWMDEYGDQDESYRNTGDYGTYLAVANSAAMNAGAQTTLDWLYEDQYYTWPLDTETNGDSFYNGLHKWGTQPWLPTSINVRPSWYAFSLMSRFLGGAGTKVYSTSGSGNGVDITATQQPDGNWSIMLVNENTSATSVNVSFSNALDKTLYRHLFDPANTPTNNTIIGTSAQFANVGTSLSDTLPAHGVAIYTSIDDGSENQQNLALGKPVTTSSTVSWTSSYSGANLTDGNNGNFWTSQELSSSAANEWAYVDLGSQTSFQRVVLYPRTNSGTGGDAFPSAFQIQGSNDASSWTTLDSESAFPDPGGVGGASFWVGPQSYRYVRVLVTSARTDGANYYVQLAEMEIYNSALSSGKTASASSTVNWTTTYGASNLTDGQNNDFWTSQELSGSSANEWAEVDLGSQTSFGRVALYPRTVNGVTEAFPSAFSIQGSNDNANWTTLANETSFANPSPDAGVAFWLGPQSYRYVRVSVTTARPDDGGNYYVQFSEIEVH